MAADALTKFSEAVLNEAGNKRRELLDEIEKESIQRIADKKKELERKKRKAILTGEAKIKQNAALAVSAHRVELKKNLFDSRTKMMNEVLGEVEKNVREFVGTEEYAKYLKRELANEDEIFSQGEVVCISREEDSGMLKNILAGKKVIFEQTNDDIIGGFRLRNETLKLYADCTFASKLAEQREWFFENSGLILK